MELKLTSSKHVYIYISLYWQGTSFLKMFRIWSYYIPPSSFFQPQLATFCICKTFWSTVDCLHHNYKLWFINFLFGEPSNTNSSVIWCRSKDNSEIPAYIDTKWFLSCLLQNGSTLDHVPIIRLTHFLVDFAYSTVVSTPCYMRQGIGENRNKVFIFKLYMRYTQIFEILPAPLQLCALQFWTKKLFGSWQVFLVICSLMNWIKPGFESYLAPDTHAANACCSFWQWAHPLEQKFLGHYCRSVFAKIRPIIYLYFLNLIKDSWSSLFNIFVSLMSTYKRKLFPLYLFGITFNIPIATFPTLSIKSFPLIAFYGFQSIVFTPPWTKNGQLHKIQFFFDIRALPLLPLLYIVLASLYWSLFSRIFSVSNSFRI